MVFRTAALLTLAGAAFVAWTTLSATPARADSGLSVDATTTYRLKPNSEVVQVTVSAQLVNNLPPRRAGAYIQTPYFDSFTVPVLGPVRNVKATSSAGGTLPVDIDKRRLGISIVTADLTPELVYGRPQTLTVNFELPGRPPRSRSVTRVNDAFASWFILAVGDPGKIDVVIDVPAEFDLLLTRNPRATVRERGDRRIHELTNVRKIANTEMFASATNDRRLTAREVRVADMDVTIKGWPDDPRWGRFAERTVKKGLPVLQDLIGREAPEKRLTVLESSRSYQFGYAGVYIPELGVVEVGDQLDDLTILHELSHVWLNDDLLVGRWITEGLAEEMANRAMTAIGEKPSKPRRVNPAARGAIALNRWSNLTSLGGASAKTEAFAYNASYAVVHDLAEEIGADRMRDVIATAADGRIPYRGDPAPEKVSITRDWRYFYDTLELVGGATGVRELFEAHVLTAQEIPALVDRKRARQSLEELTTAGAGWTPPFAVRERMAAWDFAAAQISIGKAEDMLARAHTVVDRLEAVGIDARPALETEYETAAHMSALEKTVADYEDAAGVTLAASHRMSGANPVERVGLIGADRDLRAAGTAIAAGDLAAAREAAAAAMQTVDAATQRGALILTALILLIAVTIALWRSRRRTSSAPAGPAPVGAEGAL